MSDDDAIERRLAAIEATLAEIQRRLGEPPDQPRTGWRRIVGSMRDEPGFEEMLKYGREYRMADRPAESEE
jgi:hypothetical protein